MKRSAKPKTGKSRLRKGVTAKNFLSLSSPTHLLCRPLFYNISYQINPWMDVGNKSDYQEALCQWQELEWKLQELEARPTRVKPQRGLPDMVFTANAGLILKGQKKFVLSNFRYPERAGEEIWFEQWFQDNGYEVIKLSPYFEGAGDALYLGDTLIGGYGFRSDKLAYSNITDVTVQLQDSRFYHLDTCFCPLKDNDYLIFPGAFTAKDRAMLQGMGNEMVVPEDEALKFGCNAVCVGRNVILPAGCPTTMQILESKGYTPHPLEMSEFIKSGGACKCLTLEL